MANDDLDLGPVLAGIGPPPMDDGDGPDEETPSDEMGEAAFREAARGLIDAVKNGDVGGVAEALRLAVQISKEG